jgi:signal transduction histidine kinase
VFQRRRRAPHPGGFDLLRRFTSVGLAVTLAVSILTGFATVRILRNALLVTERDEADSLAEDLVSLFVDSGFGPERWGRESVPEGIRSAALREMANFGISEFTVYSGDGDRVLELLLEGSPAGRFWQAGFDAARAGRVGLRWEGPAGWPPFLTPVSTGAVESYTPVRGASGPVAVARVRRDLDPVLVEAQKALPRLMIVAALAGTAVFAVLWLLVRRAHRTIAAQRRELEEKNRVLEELGRRRDEFYAMCSHDLRSPLLSVQAGCRLLLDDDAGAEALDPREVLGENLRGTEIALGLIHDLLDAARLETGTDDLRIEEVDVADLLRAVEAGHRFLAARHGVAIELELPGHPLVVPGDRVKLQRVFGNLVSNAIQHGRERPVTLSVAPGDGDVVIRVSDRGPGIPAEQRHTVFERFVRGVNGSAHPGTGLGLFIVREFVRMHGGSVSVESETGRGTTFRVVLPAARAETASARP